MKNNTDEIGCLVCCHKYEIGYCHCRCRKQARLVKLIDTSGKTSTIMERTE